MCVRVLDKKGLLFIVGWDFAEIGWKKKKKLECLLKNFERTHGDK